ncbi:MAG: Gfo/Idh/MocA family oxidoreductase [Planctomycetaceae bacterium]
MIPPRRTFLKTGAAAAAASMLSDTASPVAIRHTQAPIRIGFIGCGGMGSNHLRTLSKRSDVQVVAVCDVDTEKLAAAAKIISESTGREPQKTDDLRTILSDASVDCVFIATPDHWHAPAAIMALDAGKHVYVEKPCCHNIREGQLLAQAVQRSGKRLQVGTQSRSTDCVKNGLERIQNGDIGDILVAKAWNSQRRRSIGKSQPGTPPTTLNFDTWLGPAPVVPWRPNLLHSVWRWWYDFGCGDIGNDGVHDIDVALWGLGVDSNPTRVTCFGQKNYFDDDQQFPDTQYAICEYPRGDQSGRCRQLIFEQRIWSPYVQEGYENGAAFYGTEGVLIMGHTVGWKLFGPRNKLLAEESGAADLSAHHQNFFDAIRDPAVPLNASVEVGRLSANVVHLANIAARTQQVLEIDPKSEEITNSEAANSMVRRSYRVGHWAVPKDV